MSESGETGKESSSVIREIEFQLERLLVRRKDEIGIELAARIREEEEAARARTEGVEKDFQKERESLREFQSLAAEAEEERRSVLDEIRERSARALELQTRIESLAGQTVEEIRKVGDLQQKLESLRLRTSERASFLKTDLKERFGIVAETGIDGSDRPAGPPDLDEELEKLRRLKALLSSGAADDHDLSELSGPGREDAGDPGIPTIPDLIQASAPVEDVPEPASVVSEVELSLKRLRKIEPVEGSGEISYFQQGAKTVLDAGRLIDAVDKAVETALKLTGKLEGTASARDRFFIKQELINGQEGLRNLVQRAITLSEREGMVPPGATTAVLDLTVLRGLVERLGMGNWANREDLASFARDAKALQSAFRERALPAEGYGLSILEELGGADLVDRTGLA